MIRNECFVEQREWTLDDMVDELLRFETNTGQRSVEIYRQYLAEGPAPFSIEGLYWIGLYRDWREITGEESVTPRWADQPVLATA